MLCTHNAGCMGMAQLQRQECSAVVVGAEEWLCAPGGAVSAPWGGQCSGGCGEPSWDPGQCEPAIGVCWGREGRACIIN